ncbi:hypothetical protein J4407_02065 [Candidatus Pacearchaeota archaeon]|nr:hypothetical protein [Candidatus Pacearchaeota archaeon]
MQSENILAFVNARFSPIDSGHSITVKLFFAGDRYYGLPVRRNTRLI